jgi:hypothetical protein
LNSPQAAARKPKQPGWDALLLALLVMAHLQVLGLAEAAALPLRLQDVLRHPVLGRLIPPGGIAAFGEVGPRPGEPVGLVLFALTLAGTLLYLVADLALAGRAQQRVKWGLLTFVIVTALILPTGKLILLRQGSGPASYTHDGGVIQTEATIQFLLEGRNPYVDDYTETPMAEWGFSEYRTALYHYPYLPWTFLFSAPFYVAGNALGFYDQRLIYLGLLAVALLLAPRLAQTPRTRLALVMVLALNPLMALDVIWSAWRMGMRARNRASPHAGRAGCRWSCSAWPARASPRHGSLHRSTACCCWPIHVRGRGPRGAISSAPSPARSYVPGPRC